MTPLMDVIFLLLTFFIYAMVLMLPAVFLPSKMHAFISGQPAKPLPAVTISIDEAGEIRVDGQVVAIGNVLQTVQRRLQENPQTVIYLAAHEHGTIDRLPAFLSLYDQLSNAGLEIKIVGRPAD